MPDSKALKVTTNIGNHSVNLRNIDNHGNKAHSNDVMLAVGTSKNNEKAYSQVKIKTNPKNYIAGRTFPIAINHIRIL